MKISPRRFLLQFLFLWFYLGACPLAVRYFLSDTAPVVPPESTVSPMPSAAVQETIPDALRILDTSTGTTLYLSEADFLPLSVLCTLSPDAPDAAVQAQAVAIRSTAWYAHLHNATDGADFSCRSGDLHVYAPDEKFADLYGDAWPDIHARFTALCRETENLVLTYSGSVVPAPFFAVSAGCTQPADAVEGTADLAWLTAVPCPTDLLRPDCRAETTLTPDTVRAAFPGIAFTESPETWFSALVHSTSGYVESVNLCGTVLSGQDVREALALRSAAFSVSFDGENFRMLTLGAGDGVGMSQAGALYLAETGADYRSILAYFYPGTELAAK